MGRVGGSGCDPGHAARARKVMVTVAAAWSFDRASAKLRDICSMTVSDDTIERVCVSTKASRHASGCVVKRHDGSRAFEQTPGEPEFYSDGLKVNTVGGWREMRLNLLQKRESARRQRRRNGTIGCCPKRA